MINYFLRRWDALTRLLENGRLCMSNNAAERELRVVAVGRKIGPEAAGVPLPSTASSSPSSSMASPRRLGLPMCWRVYRITMLVTLTKRCLGTGSF